MLVAALGAGGATLYQQFYGPSAFVVRYLDLLSEGRAADALRVPGVAIDRETLEVAGIGATASEALLRHSALAPLTDVEVLSEKQDDAGKTEVTVSFSASGHAGTTTFTVEQDGWAGVTPNWRFTTSPLAVVELTLRGADQFAVNGFEMDRRQVSAAGAQAAPLDPLPLLVFTPGLYSVTVDTAIADSDGVGVLADTPLATTPIDVQTEPTPRIRRRGAAACRGVPHGVHRSRGAAADRLPVRPRGVQPPRVTAEVVDHGSAPGQRRA